MLANTFSERHPPDSKLHRMLKKGMSRNLQKKSSTFRWNAGLEGESHFEAPTAAVFKASNGALKMEEPSGRRPLC